MVEKSLPAVEPLRRGRPRLMGRDARRAFVLEAAIAVFADDGLHGASMEEIAARAGVPKASCYEAFPSKEALFAAAVREVDRQLNVALESTARDAARLAPRDRMRRRFGALFDFARRRPASFRLFTLSLFNGTGDIDRAHEAIREAALDRLAGDVRRGAEAAGVPGEHLDRLLASILFGIAGGALRAVANDPELDLDSVADLLTDFTTAGLAALSTHTLATITTPTPAKE